MDLKKPLWAVFGLLLFLGVCCFVPGVTPIANACFICGSNGGYPSCMQAAGGAEGCVGYSQPPYCSTFGSSCCQNCGCGNYTYSCGYPYCCAKETDPKKNCTKLKKMAFQISPNKSELPQNKRYDKDTSKQFLDMLEQGTFDKPGTVVYLPHDGPIMKALMQTSVDHWKKFSQTTTLQGAQKDVRLDSKYQTPGTPQVFINIETKTGHKVTIHVIKNPEPQKPVESPNPQL